jgi:hypothetical protein
MCVPLSPSVRAIVPKSYGVVTVEAVEQEEDTGGTVDPEPSEGFVMTLPPVHDCPVVVLNAFVPMQPEDVVVVIGIVAGGVTTMTGGGVDPVDGGGVTTGVGVVLPPPMPPPEPTGPGAAETIGVTGALGDEGDDEPLRFVAVTVKVYCVLFVRPLMTIGDPAPVAVRLPGVDVTV